MFGLDDWKVGVSLAVAIAGSYVAILWLSAIVWTYRDVRDRSNDVLSQVIAVLLVIVFNIPGLIIYLILRPHQTLTEAYERNLEMEAMLHEVGEQGFCPTCRRRVQPDFLFCPHCSTHLRSPCVSCEKPLVLSWQVCPYCGARQPAMRPQPGAATPEKSSMETTPKLSPTPPPPP
jgi:hypothetical protein